MSKKRGSILSSTSEEQKLRYDKNYFSVYREDPKRVEMYRSERDRIETFKKNGKILDVGCGIGGFLSQFDMNKWDRYGADVSDLAVGEARQSGIKVKDFSNAYDYPDEFFDVIVFRGSLQLIPTPFYVLETCIRLLAPGGYVVFLSTPNSNSPYYRRFKTLPVLTPHGNFLIPSDIMMKDVLQNFGLEVSKISYPYIGGPYANPLRDHFSYFLSFFGINLKFPFWRSSMEIYAYKPLKTDSVPSGEN